MSKRKSTKFVGVQARESESRRFRGRPDVCYTIDYKDASGKRIRKDVGWLSEGFSAAYASELRRELLHGSKVGALDVPMPEKAMPLGEAWELYRKDWLVPQKKDLKPCISLINGPLKDLKDLPLDRIDARVLDGVMAEMAGCGSLHRPFATQSPLCAGLCAPWPSGGCMLGRCPLMPLLSPSSITSASASSRRKRPGIFWPRLNGAVIFAGLWP